MTIAQLVELQIVILAVIGSIPIGHPKVRWAYANSNSDVILKERLSSYLMNGQQNTFKQKAASIATLLERVEKIQDDVH